MNRDVRELYKLYEQTVSSGNTQLTPQAGSIYNVKVPENQDINAARYFYKLWREFEEKNPYGAFFVQLIDPTTVTGWPDIYRAGKQLMEVDKNDSVMTAWHISKLIFFIFAAIPIYVPGFGWVGKVFGLLKTGAKVKPRIAIEAVDAGLKFLKTPAGIKFTQEALTKSGMNPEQIAKIIEGIQKADTYKLAEDILQHGKVDTKAFKEGIKDAAEEANKRVVRPKGVTDENISKVVRIDGLLRADPLLTDTLENGLLAKVKYWLGTKGGKGTVEEAIEFLRKGDYSGLDEGSRKVLNEILEKYKINEETFTNFVKMIYRTDPEEVIDDIIMSTAKNIDNVGTAGARAADDVVGSAARSLDDIATEHKDTINFLNQTMQRSLPKSAQDLGEKALKKGGSELYNALQKINLRKVGGVGAKALTSAEERALKASEEFLEKKGSGIFKKAAGKAAALVVLKGLVTLKIARSLANWLQRQYEKGQAYRPTAPGTVTNTVVGTDTYVPQGSTASNPQGRKGPGALKPTSTNNQYQYKPVKWWSTQ